MNIHLFGDQTSDQLPIIQKLCARKDSSLLTSFLEQVSVVLREEVQQLPRTQRANIPDFLTVLNLVESYHEQKHPIPQLESCLVTISQLAHYIG